MVSSSYGKADPANPANLVIHSNPNGASKKWYDNVVAATSYIGPMVR